MHVARRVRETLAPLIDVIKDRVAALEGEAPPIINLGQAIPGFPPAPAALERARLALQEPDTHVYSADAGLWPLREALGNALERENGLLIDPASEIIITAGGNHAFMMALMTLLEAGDRVLLPSPYFLNHEMAVRIVGGVPVEVPLAVETGFQLRLTDLQDYLKPGVRALVIVTPNNPTGAVFDPDELVRIGRAAAAHDIALITDETYRHFVYGESRHFSLGSVAELRPRVITTGSLSKTYSLTGWRVGYLAGPRDFIREALKIQDTMVICAPVVGQKAALGALTEPEQTLATRREILDRRRQVLYRCLAEIPQLSWRPTQGSFFVFARVQGCTDSVHLAMDILDRAHVVTIPGRAFGNFGEGFLRLSYGRVDPDQIQEACRRLAQYFRNE